MGERENLRVAEVDMLHDVLVTYLAYEAYEVYQWLYMDVGHVSNSWKN